ncbi:cytochrome P450 [Dendryphion nanum]|uniref:Cytochrome P450 n=1 Tax=Dendryphion nanum TaxID=256645 RepID=A0A9P9EBD6_9PLEO|nr:cytochrome P450 [Dendryphion nanum]
MSFLNVEYLILLVVISVAYFVYGIIWRLWLSPIAHIPGPRLAAATRLYEAYYDLVLGGQYTFKIGELHKQYGPIIRISPWEVHIHDPDFYNTLYAPATTRRKSDKYPFFTKFLGLDLCVFATVEHDLHRKRRAALLPYFSMASVRRLQPVIQERIDVLLNRMKGFRDGMDIVNASCMFSALTNDVVNLYSFARCDHRLEDPNFDPWARDAALAGANSGAFMKHAPWVNTLLKSLPNTVTKLVLPALATFTEQKRTSEAQVKKIIAGENEEWRGKEYPTIFHSVLDSKLPPEEKSIERLADDAQMVVMAGTLTTASTLELIHFWLLSQPDTLLKLKRELRSAIPNPEDIGKIPLPTIEALPYLTAVIKEGLRLSYGVSCRLQRIDPDNTLEFIDKTVGKKWAIPAGTPVGSTSVLIHRDETIFPASETFSPERWLDGQGPSLEKYLVSFCAGSRRCFGENLAYAELYLGLAAIWRDDGVGADDVGAMSLWETDRRDVEIESDQFVPVAKKGSKGIRVKVWGVRAEM